MSIEPDFSCLFDIASSQHGYVTTAQAKDCGFSSSLLTYHTQNGRLDRRHRGVYRLQDFPSSPREDVVAAWLAAGTNTAVVSRDSALDLLDLSDVIPDTVHLTVPRSRRHLPNLPGVTIHTTTYPLGPMDVIVRDGVRLTSATRTILDTAAAGTAPEQIELAVQQALDRGLTTRRQLEKDATTRSARVVSLIADSIARGAT